MTVTATQVFNVRTPAGMTVLTDGSLAVVSRSSNSVKLFDRTLSYYVRDDSLRNFQLPSYYGLSEDFEGNIITISGPRSLDQGITKRTEVFFFSQDRSKGSKKFVLDEFGLSDTTR